MSYITIQNDRKRKRQARQLTFLITATMLIVLLYTLGAGDHLLALYDQLFVDTPAPGAVA